MAVDANLVQAYNNRAPLEIVGKNGKTVVKKEIIPAYVFIKKDNNSIRGFNDFGLKKTVILPENSPLRQLNVDKFTLVKARGDSDLLKMYSKNGELMLSGHENIKKFMQSIASIIRKVK